MKKSLQIFLFSTLLCATALSSPVPQTQTRITNAYWEVSGAPMVVWDSTTGIPYVFSGYLVGYAVAYDQPAGEPQVLNASFSRYEDAVRFLGSLANSQLLPRPVIAN